MCSEPNTINGEKVACRRCNRCIAERKNGWVARAMAEKATTKGETLAIELTYRNAPDGTIPPRAQMFHYHDVQNFLKRIRQAYYRQYKKAGEIRYIVAGEHGSKKDRVHWHFVIFADRPVSTLGTWADARQNPQKEMRKATRNHWSMWEHGHVFPREPDQGGLQYVLKYAVKDQFNEVKSRGTMREAKSENHAASYFRMSKKPPLGKRYLDQQMQRWAELGAVPPALQVRIPDYKGYWWPKGDLREYLLDGLHEINNRIKRTVGRDAPQWNTLLQSVVEREKDWETLNYGDYQEKETEYLEKVWKDEIERRDQERQKRYIAHQAKRKCGGVVICKACWGGKTRDEQDEYRRWYSRQADRCKAEWGEDEYLESWFRKRGKINPYCTHKDAPYPPGTFIA